MNRWDGEDGFRSLTQGGSLFTKPLLKPEDVLPKGNVVPIERGRWIKAQKARKGES